tara:strand:- start:186 stop:704 length:519 start_codon:yes stop_codon:yes gene_type:complete
MSEESSDWKKSLFRPSITFSTILFFIGCWIVILSIINIVLGAYSPGNKVLWIGFLTDGVSNTSDMTFVIDDGIFLILGILSVSLGVMGINSIKEGGFMKWALEIHKGTIFRSLLSAENGLTRSIGSWMLVFGIVFYVIWSLCYNTWVDPGVYSICISLIAFGLGLHIEGNER